MGLSSGNGKIGGGIGERGAGVAVAAVILKSIILSCYLPTTRPHPSPAAPPFPSKGKVFLRLCEHGNSVVLSVQLSFLNLQPTGDLFRFTTDKQRIFALREKRAATAHITSAIAALYIKFQPTQTTKNFPEPGVVRRPLTAPRLALQHGTFRSTVKQPPAQESSGRMREVWREKRREATVAACRVVDLLPKGPPSPSKVFLPSPHRKLHLAVDGFGGDVVAGVNLALQHLG